MFIIKFAKNKEIDNLEINYQQRCLKQFKTLINKKQVTIKYEK